MNVIKRIICCLEIKREFEKLSFAKGCKNVNLNTNSAISCWTETNIRVYKPRICPLSSFWIFKKAVYSLLIFSTLEPTAMGCSCWHFQWRRSVLKRGPCSNYSVKIWIFNTGWLPYCRLMTWVFHYNLSFLPLFFKMTRKQQHFSYSAHTYTQKGDAVREAVMW